MSCTALVEEALRAAVAVSLSPRLPNFVGSYLLQCHGRNFNVEEFGEGVGSNGMHGEFPVR